MAQFTGLHYTSTPYTQTFAPNICPFSPFSSGSFPPPSTFLACHQFWGSSATSGLPDRAGFPCQGSSSSSSGGSSGSSSGGCSSKQAAARGLPDWAGGGGIWANLATLVSGVIRGDTSSAGSRKKKTQQFNDYGNSLQKNSSFLDYVWSATCCVLLAEAAQPPSLPGQTHEKTTGGFVFPPLFLNQGGDSSRVILPE